MSNLYPKLRLRVKTYDENQLVSQLLPGDRESIIYQLKNQTVWFPFYQYPLKHGDIIEFEGIRAVEIYRNLDQYNSGGRKVEVLYYEPLFVANKVSLLIDTNYVDYNPGYSSSEAYNLLIGLESFGKDVITIPEFTSEALQNALISSKYLIVPELESLGEGGGFRGIISSNIASVISDWVYNGGKYIAFYPNDLQCELLNDIFSFNLTTGDGSGQYNKTVDAVGTIFENGSNSIPDLSATDTIEPTSLPPNSIVVYQTNGGTGSALTIIPYGSGEITIFGWDWYDAAPYGSEDGGWLELLELAVS